MLAYHELAHLKQPQHEKRQCRRPNGHAPGRAFDYYLHSSYKAALQLQPTREPLALTPMRAGVAPETPATYEAALE